jgi:hypothetical protein
VVKRAGTSYLIIVVKSLLQETSLKLSFFNRHFPSKIIEYTIPILFPF